METQMSFFVYEYHTTITNPALLVDGDEKATALNLVQACFRDSTKIAEHTGITASFKNDGRLSGIYRHLDGNMLCTKRVYTSEAAAQAAKAAYDAVYADNLKYQQETGLTGVTYSDSIYEATTAQIQDIIDHSTATHF